MSQSIMSLMISVIPLLWVCLAFAWPLKKKEHFGIRLLAVFIIWSAIYSSFRFFQIPSFLDIGLYYVMLFIGLKLILNNKWSDLIYVTIWSVFIYRLITNSSQIFYHSFLINFQITHNKIIIAYFIYSAIAAVVIALTIGRFMPREDRYDIGPRQFISTLLLVALFEFFDFLLLYNGIDNFLSNYHYFILGMQFYCVTIVYIQQILFNKSALKTERDTLDYLWHHQQSQYNISKDNIDLINQKCHDLKHQIKYFRHHEMKSACDEDLTFLKSIEKAIDIYDAIVHTGNEVLDTILTEKSLYCQKNYINISCVADGKKLDFMASADIYSIFGNALDNAIESVIKIKDVDKRLVDVLIYQKNNFLVVNIINPIEEHPVFDGELPESTKPKNGYHGFGLKSIRHTVKHYSGTMNVDIKEDKFKLTILFPLNEQNEED